jgi:hypothetical protein
VEEKYYSVNIRSVSIFVIFIKILVKRAKNSSKKGAKFQRMELVKKMHSRYENIPQNEAPCFTITPINP